MARRRSKGRAMQPEGTVLEEMTASNGDGKPLAAAVLPPEKSVREQELDRLVWGDEDGFRTAVATYQDEGMQVELMNLGHGSADEGEGAQDLGGMDDSELFFLDIVPDSNIKALAPAQTTDADSDQEDNVPAWIDSDDERLTVSLATTNRLRKLRRYEGEDVVNGLEYSRRLRQQYERLYPAPDWAAVLKLANTQPQSKRHRQKRRRLSASGSISDSASSTSSGSSSSSRDDDTNFSTLKAAPLQQLLQTTTPLVSALPSKSATGRTLFRPESIDIQRTKDVKSTSPSSITSLSFHPSHPVLVSSGPSGLISLHHISPTSRNPNPELTSLAIPRLSITTSAIHPSGQRIIFAGRRRFFHVWHLGTGSVTRVSRIQGHAATQRTFERFKPSPCGRYVAFVGSGRKGGGTVNVVDADTMHWRCEARAEGKGGVADLAWWADGEGLAVLGKGGDALEYSVAEKRPVARWHDEGAVGTTVVSMGGRRGAAGERAASGGLGPDRWIAVGSASGIVNVYDRLEWRLPSFSAAAAGGGTKEGVPPHPTPAKTLAQLTTPTSHLSFSPDGQLLAMGSRWKRDALRIVHVAAGRVYAGWPTSGTPLGRITALAWGEKGNDGALLLAVGNEQGKIRLWEVQG